MASKVSDTVTLLEKVRIRLYYERPEECTTFVEELFSISGKAIDENSNDESCYTWLNSILSKEASFEPNVTSRIFAAVHWFLTRQYACRVHVMNFPFNWPCPAAYNSEARTYLFKGRRLDVSVMQENGSIADTFFYICFRMREKKHFYFVDDLPRSSYSLNLKHATKEKDLKCLLALILLISNAMDSFCDEVVYKSKYNSKEFSPTGLFPILSDPPAEPRPKRRKLNRSPPLTFDQAVIPEYYANLAKIYESSSPKPNRLSRLFALVHAMCVNIYNCRSSINEAWPGGPEYSSEVVQLWCLNMNRPRGVYGVFNFSLLETGSEIYCCFRYSLDYQRKCIRRLNQSLIPSYEKNHAEMDIRRIENLTHWLSAVFKQFIQKTLNDKKTTDMSFVSLHEPTSPVEVMDETCLVDDEAGSAAAEAGSAVAKAGSSAAEKGSSDL